MALFKSNITKQRIIDELKFIISKEKYDIYELKNHIFKFDEFNVYFNSLIQKSKPETAANFLIMAIIKDIFEMDLLPEINTTNGFVDFKIHKGENDNPIMLELKPFFLYNEKNGTLSENTLNYKVHQDQVQKYLKDKNVEYLILTNIKTAYIFSRTALIDYKPFAEKSFIEIYEDYQNNENLWETIKKYEDNEKPVNLDVEFFVDLKKWFNEFNKVKFIEDAPFSPQEIAVLFINKFIFIKTLEDFGLIPYKHIHQEFKEFSRKWAHKGDLVVFSRFFEEVELFIDEHYNTELFSTRFFDYLEKDETNLRIFRSVFENILGLDNWSNTFGKGLIHYNYRFINEDIFGKAYETWIAENKKDEGIYYTPATITEYMAEITVKQLFEDKVNSLIENLKAGEPNQEVIESQIKDIQDIKIIDSSSGSGSFLIKVLREVHKYYKKIDEATNWVNNFTDPFMILPNNAVTIQKIRKKLNFINPNTPEMQKGEDLKQIAGLILNHIFAADKDERAIDTAKTNLWKEAIKLNPRIYNYRKLNTDKVHILPNLEMNFIKGDSLTDFDFNEQIGIIYSKFKADIIELFKIRNSYLNNVFNPDLLNGERAIKNKILSKLKENHQFKDSLFFPLEFFFCYFDESGEPLAEDQRGFDGIISNPPWEAIKPVKKEFAKQTKYEMDIHHFTSWFENELKTNEEFNLRWQKYTEYYSNYTDYLYKKYSHQSNGDPNLYKFFMERDFQLIKSKATFCLLIPSGFQTDEGSNQLRKLIIDENTIKELYSFENRGYFEENKKNKVKLFPEVDNRFKFSIVYADKISAVESYFFNAKFYMTDPKELYNENHIKYNIEKIKQFSPDNLSIMEFRTEQDYKLCLKIIEGRKILSEFEFDFKREFEISSNTNYLITDSDAKIESTLKLVEGKTIHQFNSAFGLSKYKIKEEYLDILKQKEIKKITSLNSKIDNNKFEIINYVKFKFDFENYRLVYRRIGSSTNERSIISTIVPPNSLIADSLNFVVNNNYELYENNIVLKETSKESIVFLMSLLNSITLNFYIRNKISANLSLFFIYELPIAEANEGTKRRITELGFNLLYRKSNRADFEDLRQELGVEIDEERNLSDIRAELEWIIASELYKLSKDDWDYLCSTFVYGESATRIELDEIIKLSKEYFR